jgi:hypothetical protein
MHSEPRRSTIARALRGAIDPQRFGSNVGHPTDGRKTEAYSFAQVTCATAASAGHSSHRWFFFKISKLNTESPLFQHDACSEDGPGRGVLRAPS